MMNRVLILILILAATAWSQAVPAPLTQTEYVRYLYSAQKDPEKLEELINALRTRGIGFDVTEAVRGLTRTKTGGNEDLRRALESAGRRRANSSLTATIKPADGKRIIAEARKAALEALEEMPDFVVKQLIQRSAAYAGTNNFRSLDRLVVGVSYRASGQEEYRLLSLNGVIQENVQSKSSYAETGGTSSTGEFVTVLAKIFKPESETVFEVVETDLVRGRNAAIFSFSIEKDKAKQAVVASGVDEEVAITGMRGKIWVDLENYRVLTVESEATELPATFPIRSARRIINYDWVKINDATYLLPITSDVRLTFRESKNVFETRNLIRFRDYQKFGTEVKILDGDDEEIPEQQ